MDIKRLAILTVIVALGLSSILIVNNLPSNNLPSNDDNIGTLREGFVSDCNRTGNQNEYCNCTFNSLLLSYGPTGFVKASYEYSQDGVLSDEMYGAVGSCISKYNREDL